jgi:hypothetical protein
MWETDRLPAFWETWKGRNLGSLYKVLNADQDSVTYLVMWQGNRYWHDQLPPGSVASMTMNAFLNMLEYAPEWND